MDRSERISEIARRRTFAIISHPDAGKTTLTEKLLLYGGAIQLAGSVRARRDQPNTTSDWMELEKERGISVSSTLLQFDYGGCVINLLDTPGHRDFSEDTYRVLTAVDSVIMVIDAAKGIEERTRKLFEICRLRGIPIFTFMNKMDRPALAPLDLIDELEKTLGITAFPVTWPLGNGESFCGVYDRLEKKLHLFDRSAHGAHKAPTRVAGIRDQALRDLLGNEAHDAWVEEVEMLDLAGDTLDPDALMRGDVTPVFFGSGITNFGVQLLLDYFVKYGAKPQPRKSTDGTVIDPASDAFSAFVFKVQANMNPKHRDRLTFIRVCSGVFEKDMLVDDPNGGGKPIRLAYPQKLFAQDRESIETALPGDIVGLVMHSAFKIGATLTTDKRIRYDEIPRFSPEAFATIRNIGTDKQKQFREGLDQLLDEGVIQAFVTPDTGLNTSLLGAVGQLQFDVVMHRLQTEYGANPKIEPAPFAIVRWFDLGVTIDQYRDAYLGIGVKLAHDLDGNLVILFPTQWALDYFMEKNPKATLHAVSPLAKSL